MFLRLRALGLVGILTVAACSASEPDRSDSSSADVISLVPGSQIGSANAKSNATYLSIRSIANLQSVGALAGPLLDLANRTDGIISSQPDGRLSLAELTQIEKPGFVETLFPEEKAALPQLWSLMETTNAAPQAISVPDASRIEVIDVSSPATSPIEPASLTIDSLPSTLQRAAQRLELTDDSNSTATTVTKADLAAAIANPGPYLPAEIAQFKQIQQLFADRAGTTLDAKVQVNAPIGTTSTLATWGAATLSLQSSLNFTENRTMDGSYTWLQTQLGGHVSQSAVVTLSSTVKIIMLDTGSEKEAIVASGPLTSDAGTKTLEVWAGGVRQGSFRATLPALKQVNTDVDLSQYADYRFVLADGTPLVKNAVSSSYAYQSSFGATVYQAGFTYDPDTHPSAAVTQQYVDGVRTPSVGVAPGRYAVPCGPSEGNVTVDLFPEGIVRVTRTNGTVTRASWSSKTFSLTAAELGFTYDPVANKLTITKNGTVVFTGPLTGALRAG